MESQTKSQSDGLPIVTQHVDHERRLGDNRYVYAVISRRSKGLSVGVNLNPDRICNFDCVYCQVDRSEDADWKFVDIDQLIAELSTTLDRVADRSLFDDPRFSSTPIGQRRFNDIAMAGDGEPTTFVNFDRIVEAIADLKRARGLDDVKLVVLSNASRFARPAVLRGLDTLMASNGEIWAKLDAGTPEYFARIERTAIHFEVILENLLAVSRRHPLVIQSMFLRYEGAGPSEHEISAYIERLQDLRAGGGAMKLIQLYTIARPTAEAAAVGLTNAELDAIAARVRQQVDAPVETYYGVGT